MNKETKKKLLAPFPEEVVQDPPKGKFGKFVNHAVYVERLRDCDVKYEWEFEPVIIDNKIVGAIGKLTIDGLVYQGAGDVEAPALARATVGECLKLAESDAFKRASMRAGLGVELWSGTDDFYDDEGVPPPKPKPNKPSPTAKEVAVTTNESANKFAEDIGATKQSVADQLNTILKEMIPNAKKMGEVKTKVYKDMVNATEVSDDVNNWTSKDMDKFLNRVEVLLDDENILDVVFDTQPVQDETKGDEMTDIPSGAWEQEPPTDKQLKTFNDKVAQATDDGQTELVKKAKDFLASGNATKKNIFDWIDTDGDWTLKDPS